MSTFLTDEGHGFIRRLRFSPEVEADFQENYYRRVRPALRMGLCAIIALGLIIGLAQLRSATPGANPTAVLSACLAVAFFNLLLLGATFLPKFTRHWQFIMATSVFVSLGLPLAVDYKATLPLTVTYTFLIWFRIYRLQLRWITLQYAVFMSLSTISDLIHPEGDMGKWLAQMALSLLLMAPPLFFTLRSERFDRREFWTRHFLERERNDERQKREQTEKMLHILSQAIGGIVHDLGNPLTSVQSGADTLLLFVQDGEPDREVVQEFAEIILSGAQMLNYLRLSLMEQTRVLEGKPVPVDLKPTSLSHIIKAGAQFQKPKFSAGRNVCLHGEELQVMADEMRMVTVFMNLIGNALKYSDGEVRIGWHTHGEQVLIAVSDRGRAGQGISQAQAEGLFVAFGRLDTHAEVEGTGLGLLSVRKIVEAHGGEIYIEGRSDGTDSSASFCTARGSYPDMLEEGFLTAFVAACPLEIVPQEVEPQEAIFQTSIPAPEELVCLTD